MAEVPQLSFKAEAEKLAEEEARLGKSSHQRMKNKLDRFNKFDAVADDVTKVAEVYSVPLQMRKHGRQWEY